MATTPAKTPAGAISPEAPQKPVRERIREYAGALNEPKYRRYWLGSLASVGAIQVAMIGMLWLIKTDLGGSASTLGYLGGAIAIPTILVNLFGGVLADRLDRRVIMMVVSGATATLMTLLAVLVVTGFVEVWHVLVIAAVQGFFQGFDGPVRSSFFPLLIERKHMMSAVALNTVMWNFSRILTPLVAGFAIEYLGTESVFFAGAVGWITMLLIIFTLRVPHTKSDVRRKVMHELGEGVGFIARNRLFAVIVPLTFANMFFGMQYLQLMPLFAIRHDVGASGMSVIFTFLGLGSITGTLLIGRRQRCPDIGRTMLGATFLFSLLIPGFAFAPSYPAALALIYFVGITNSIFLISSMTALQLRVPAHLRGRVMGIYTITFSLIPLGGLMGGLIADALDERWAVTIASVILSLIVIGVFITQREVRNLSGAELEQDVPTNRPAPKKA
jgi:MFS family permease